MRAAAIICEYNPFHEGHRYHVEETRRRTGAECVIGIMSGEFVQRGEPAAEELSVRAKRAVDGGIDMLVLLPYVYACSGAELFASGGCRIAEMLGAEYLSFGVETEDTEGMREVAELLSGGSESFAWMMDDLIAGGMPYAAAREKAVSDILGRERGELLRNPNTILAVEYIKALLRDAKAGADTPKPLAVRRIGAGHGSDGDPSYSATAARRVLAAGGAIPTLDSLTAQAVSIILRSDPSELEKYGDAEEGLGVRLRNAAAGGGNLSDIVRKVSTKHLTEARIRRMVCNIVTNESAIDRDRAAAAGPFLRLLGLNETGRQYLSLREDGAPVFSRGKDIEKYCRGLGSPMFRIECGASDQYGLLIGRAAGECYRFTPYVAGR